MIDLAALLATITATTIAKITQMVILAGVMR